MKKKFLQMLTVPGLLLGLSSPIHAEDNSPIKVNLNNTLVNFPDAAPYIDINSRVLVPIRFVAEQLGSQVDWNGTTETVKMVKGSKTIELTIGQTEASVNGQAVHFDSMATIESNRTYVPLRFISETFGSKVAWDASSRVVNITGPSVADRNDIYKSAPPMQIDPTKSYVAEIKTNLGSFKMELYAKDAPQTVNNFIFLAKDGYYDGITFHRIIKDFMIQTGDPLGNGTGGPGYSFADELPPKVGYAEGIVAMANAGPDTNGSQFFICTGEASKQLNYNPNYTVFGKVTEGMDVVAKIADTPVGLSSYGEPSKPKVEVKIESVKIN